MNKSIIVAALLSVSLAGLAAANPPPARADKSPEFPAFKVGPVTLRQVAFHDALTGTNDHFGCLLVDTAGRVVFQANSKVWLFTGSQPPGRHDNEGWISNVRELDLATLRAEPRRQILSVQPNDRWATVHLAVRMSDGTCLLFFSTAG